MAVAHDSPNGPTEPDPCFARYPVDIMPGESEPTDDRRAAPAPTGALGRRVYGFRTLLAGAAAKVIGR